MKGTALKALMTIYLSIFLSGCFDDSLQEKAEKGDIISQYQLALLYDVNAIKEPRSKKTKRNKFSEYEYDSEQADYYYNQVLKNTNKLNLEKFEVADTANKLKNAEYYYILGRIHFDGTSTKKDYNVALKYFLTSVDLGHVVSNYFIGNIYQNGYVGLKNEHGAFKYYMKSARINHAESIMKVINIIESNNLSYNVINDIVRGGGINKDSLEIRYSYSYITNMISGVFDSKNPEIQYKLGKLYLDSDHYYKGLVKQDLGKAFLLIRKSALAGNNKAMYELGEMYRYGRGTEINLKLAADMYLRLAKLNNIGAIIELGSLNMELEKFEDGFLNYKKALTIDAKNTSALHGLLAYYRSQNRYDEMEVIYNQLIELGDKFVLFELAVFYEKRGENKKALETHKIILVSKNMSTNKSLMFLKNAYESGSFVDKDIDLAISYLAKLVDQMESYNDKHREAAKDALLRINTYAENGNATAQYYLGVEYKRGINIEYNIELAKKWLSKSDQQNNIKAKLALADLYYRGAYGVKPNTDLAIEKYLKIFESHQSLEALNILATIYQYSKKDVGKAEQVLLKAAKLGHVKSMVSLGDFYAYQGGGNVFDNGNTLKWYKAASEQGSSIAKINLGKIYISKAGESNDHVETAKYWLDLANKEGERSAIDIFVRFSLNRKDEKTAFDWLMKNPEMKPHEAHYFICDNYNRSSDSDLINKARISCEEGLKTAPERSEGLKLLFEVYKNLNDIKSALLVGEELALAGVEYVRIEICDFENSPELITFYEDLCINYN
jgi:TPR repeat protein